MLETCILEIYKVQSKKIINPVRTTLYIPKQLHIKLKIEAVNQDTSMTDIVIRAIQNELKNSKGELGES